jgi:hypothetical protein
MINIYCNIIHGAGEWRYFSKVWMLTDVSSKAELKVMGLHALDIPLIN